METPPGGSEQETLQELSGIVRQRYAESLKDPLIMERMVVFIARLREEVPEAELMGTRLYHLLAGSGMFAEAERFDVPGGLIERFIREEF
ncbi:MAG TPA: hypothetical protein VJ837_02940 [Candidatus Paceibacterota bacterium]|nr:hypothetical protein [Candidatus Paceibacterota bacterium]